MKNKKLIIIVLVIAVIISLVFLSNYFTNPSCDYNSETKKYVAKDRKECTFILYACVGPEEDYFSDECGCGCEIVIGSGTGNQP